MSGRLASERGIDRETGDESASDDDLAAVCERAETVRKQAVERACSRLAARGELTEADRLVVERLAAQIVDRILVEPADALAATEDGEAGPAAVEKLFAD